MTNDAYKRAGVDIDAADALIDKIRPLANSTHRPGVMDSIGGFGGLFSLANGYQDPVLVSGTDGTGTKLLVALQMKVHTTIGIDLVAMCVNDIIVSGAEPLFFLDYFATGKLDNHVAADVISGIAEGCRQSGCALLGGETAEMPGLYGHGHYDLAGFAVGVVERSAIRDGKSIEAGDSIVGIPSSGLHANGFSLVRKIVDETPELDITSHIPRLGKKLGDELLTPTRIYVEELRTLSSQFDIKGAAHITGGGLPGNIPRCLPDNCRATIHRNSWTIPPIFELMREAGDIGDNDLYQTFNCGIGMALVVPANQADAVAKACSGTVIGDIKSGTKGMEMV